MFRNRSDYNETKFPQKLTRSWTLLWNQEMELDPFFEVSMFARHVNNKILACATLALDVYAGEFVRIPYRQTNIQKKNS